MMSGKNKQGFTIVELIVVVAVLLVLSAAAFSWIDPLARVGEAKNKRRIQDVNVLSAALANYAAANEGVLPVLGSISTNKKVLCSVQGASNLSCAGVSQLCLTVDDDFYKYLGALPYDPDKTSAADTGYYLQKDDSNNLIVGTCASYNSEVITKNPGLKVACPAYGGGHCWYLGASLNVDCNTICAANNLTCVKNVMYGPDTNNSGTAFCHLNKDLTSGCGSSCTAASTSTPPYASSDYASCAIQTGAVTCNQAPGAAKYAICACN